MLFHGKSVFFSLAVVVWEEKRKSNVLSSIWLSSWMTFFFALATIACCWCSRKMFLFIFVAPIFIEHGCTCACVCAYNLNICSTNTRGKHINPCLWYTFETIFSFLFVCFPFSFHSVAYNFYLLHCHFFSCFCLSLYFSWFSFFFSVRRYTFFRLTFFLHPLIIPLKWVNGEPNKCYLLSLVSVGRCCLFYWAATSTSNITHTHTHETEGVNRRCKWEMKMPCDQSGWTKELHSEMSNTRLNHSTMFDMISVCTMDEKEVALHARAHKWIYILCLSKTQTKQNTSNNNQKMRWFCLRSNYLIFLHRSLSIVHFFSIFSRFERVMVIFFGHV